MTVTVSGEVVGLKSIAAYYFGLDINTNVTKQEAEEALQQVLAVWKPVLVANKNLVDYIFLLSLEFAQSHDLPMQIHTGFGDRGLNLRLSNPLYLHNVLEDKRFAKCRIVYLDFGLAIPKLSVHGMISAVKDLLEQAPLNKVMFSTDAYAFPELFYLGAKNAREVVFTVLRDSCIDGDITVSEAVEVAKDLFARNSINFYKIAN
ncbi:nodulin 6 [Trifolium pratense]|uniref:Nodulin 6 n=1 Tax=Trifolium pratense TaxID=57577 RepID=A0A2K3N568_TRIPR|nr:nodulin 6 [Trifolium pratense]